jgi:hypothetical protein
MSSNHSKLEKILSHWYIYVVSAAVGTIAAVIAKDADNVTMNTAATSLISLAAFLAAASGVLTSIYLGQILRSVPTTIEKIQPSFMDMMIQSMSKNVTVEEATKWAEARSPEQFKTLYAPFMVRVLVDVLNDSKKSLDTFMGGAKEIRQYGRNALYVLVVSALTSIFVILTQQPYLLGVSIALMIFATWSIFKGWEAAESSISSSIWMSWFFQGFVEAAKEQKSKKP